LVQKKKNWANWQRIIGIFTQKIFTKIVGIGDSGSWKYLSRIHGSIGTESQIWIRNTVYTQLWYLNRSLQTVWYGIWCTWSFSSCDCIVKRKGERANNCQSFSYKAQNNTRRISWLHPCRHHSPPPPPPPPGKW
jgi:hypothetical protein